MDMILSPIGDVVGREAHSVEACWVQESEPLDAALRKLCFVTVPRWCMVFNPRTRFNFSDTSHRRRRAYTAPAEDGEASTKHCYSCTLLRFVEKRTRMVGTIWAHPQIIYVMDSFGGKVQELYGRATYCATN